MPVPSTRVRSYLPPALTDTLSPQFGKGIDKIRQILYGLANEDKIEGKWFSGGIKKLFICRGFYDKRMGHFGVETKHPGVFRGRSFKDICVNAFLFQHAVIAWFSLYHTDDFFKGIPKSTAKYRPLICRKTYVVFRTHGESESRQTEWDGHSIFPKQKSFLRNKHHPAENSLPDGSTL